MSASGEELVSYSYDANGNRASMTTGNGVTTTYSYNSANLLTGLENASGATVLSSYDYLYQLDGNQIQKSDHNGRVTQYEYDDMGRLVLESESGSSPVSANITKAYSFDERGNRSGMVMSGGGESYTESYSYDLNNRLLSTQKVSGAIRQSSVYSYDANGNRLTRESEIIAPIGTAPERLVGFGLEEPGIERMVYNGLNQLTSVQLDGQTVGSYSYRPSGMRHSKTTAAGTTLHQWEGSYIVADETNGVITGTYLRGINLIATERNNTLSYQVYNGHGDVVQLAGEDSAIGQQYDYDAYGNQREITGQETTAPDDNPFRYSGEYYDNETGYIYLRARYYDPAVGAFINEDSIRADMNWYGYCAGNPVRFADPLGLDKIDVTPQANFDMLKSRREVPCAPSGQWVDLGKGWKVRIENAHVDNGKGQHVHLVYKDGKKNWSQNDDGTPHDKNNNSPGSPPDKVLERLQEETGWDWNRKMSEWAEQVNVKTYLVQGSGQSIAVLTYPDGSQATVSSPAIGYGMVTNKVIWDAYREATPPPPTGEVDIADSGIFLLPFPGVPFPISPIVPVGNFVFA